MSQHNEKVNSTSELLRRLFKTHDIVKFMENHSHEMGTPPFHDYISELCKTTGKIPGRVIKQASIERTYGHQLFNGIRKPSRDKVIQLAFGFELDFDGSQKLLQIAQKSMLYPRIKRDAAIIYCIVNHKNVLETQSVLHSLGLTLLGGE
jgi:hypothetical protein